MMCKEEIISLVKHSIEFYIMYDNSALRCVDQMKSAKSVYEIRKTLKEYDWYISEREKLVKEILMMQAILGEDKLDLSELDKRATRED